MPSMSAVQQGPVTASQVHRLSDGAELPLLDPRLLAALTTSPSNRHTRTASGEYLILSEADLAQFDPRRVNEVRAALSGWSTITGPERDIRPESVARLPLGLIGERWARRGTAVGATAGLAFAFGLLASLLA